MSTPAIRVEGLWKQYLIGGRERPPESFREALTRTLSAPFRRLAGSRGASRQDRWFWALQDVSFTVEPGEVVGIIGRNGAGKTTLLKLLSRITPPTRGRAEVRGRLGSLLEVGTGFHPELTGRENIYLNGAILGMKRAEIRRKFDEIVAFAEVEQFLDTPVKRYSTGMAVRLAFSIAAHLDPEVLIVDEVLAVGDAEFQRKSLGKMSDVASRGLTVLFVSHNMNAIEALCSAAMLLESGRVSMHGRAVREVIRRYLSSGSGNRREAEWLNSEGVFANPWFTPVRFCITDAGGQTVEMPVRNDDEMWVHIEGEVEREHPALELGYVVFNERGETLYWSLTTDTAESVWPKFDIGRVAVHSRIPARFLNEGQYRLEMTVGLNRRAWLCEPGRNAPTIHLRVQGGLSDSPYWVGRRSGVVAPVLRWSRCSPVAVGV